MLRRYSVGSRNLTPNTSQGVAVRSLYHGPLPASAKSIAPTVFAICFLFFALSDNPAVAATGIKIIPLFAFFAALRVIKHIRRVKHEVWFFIGAAVYLSTAGIASFYHSTKSPLLYAALALVYLATSLTATGRDLRWIIRATSSIFLVTLLLAWTALAWSVFVGSSFFTVSGLEFMPSSLMYPNTPFMRPTGFMYEPGQLSFYICLCVAARELLGLGRRASIAMLVSGLVTQSLAHLLFTLVFLVYLGLSGRRLGGKLIGVAAVVLALLALYSSGFLQWAVNRAELFYSVPEEWGRFGSFNNVLTALEGSSAKAIFGPSNALAAREYSTEDLSSPDRAGVSIYGENPLSPLVFGGLLSSWPYYAFHLYAVYCMFAIPKSRGLLVLAVALLTLQRPYTLEFPYALAISLLLTISLRARRAA